MTDTATYTLASNADYVDKPICSATGCDDDADVASAKTVGDVRVWVYACYTHSVYIGDRFATLHDAGLVDGLRDVLARVDGKATDTSTATGRALVHMAAVLVQFERGLEIERAAADAYAALDGEDA